MFRPKPPEQAEVDALTRAMIQSTWNQEAAKHCPDCYRPAGGQHDRDCDKSGEVIKGAP